jgi:hypothetical protein
VCTVADKGIAFLRAKALCEVLAELYALGCMGSFEGAMSKSNSVLTTG